MNVVGPLATTKISSNYLNAALAYFGAGMVFVCVIIQEGRRVGTALRGEGHTAMYTLDIWMHLKKHNLFRKKKHI